MNCNITIAFEHIRIKIMSHVKMIQRMTNHKVTTKHTLFKHHPLVSTFVLKQQLMRETFSSSSTKWNNLYLNILLRRHTRTNIDAMEKWTKLILKGTRRKKENGKKAARTLVLVSL